jgi:hypothetical protein
MDDAAYFRHHAERYRNLADAFSDHSISTRLATLADECEAAMRQLPPQRAGAARALVNAGRRARTSGPRKAEQGKLATEAGTRIAAARMSGTDATACRQAECRRHAQRGSLDLARERTCRMRGGLLVSAAVLAAGVAMASAQNAPGASAQEHTRNPALSQHHRAPTAAARNAEQPLRRRATHFGFQDSMEQGLNNQRRSGRGPAVRGDTSGEWGARVALHSDKPRGGAPDAVAEQDQVRQAQAALNRQGFNVGDPDGRLGKRTKEALIAFQKQHGFRTTGKVDRATLDALLASGISPRGGQSNPAVPIQAAPQGVAPATNGHGGAAPQSATSLQPTDGETPPAQLPQMPDTGATGRVPAGSPPEDE